MKNADWPSRLFDAALAAFFGVLPGLLCFWLYGLRMSHALPSRAVETGRLDALWHWVLGMAGSLPCRAWCCPCARRTLWAC